MTYPYNDSIMVYNYNTHKYVLTVEGVLEETGIQLENRLVNQDVSNPQQLLNEMLYQVSTNVYNYIHMHSQFNLFQDYLIAKAPSARNIIKNAMLEQLKYMLKVGDLSMSTDDYKRDKWFSMQARMILEQPLLENATPLLYQGHYNIFNIDLDYTTAGY